MSDKTPSGHNLESADSNIGSSEQLPKKKSSLRRRLASLLIRAPEDAEQLTQLLRESHTAGVISDDSMSMIEGVLQVSTLAARDIMVPRAQMDVIDIAEPVAHFKIGRASCRERVLMPV